MFVLLRVIHAIGGVFGAYDGRFSELLKRTPLTNQIYSHVDIVPD